MKLAVNISYRKTENGLGMIYNKIEGTLFELNETATSIVDLIVKNSELTADGIAEELARVYDASLELITEEVKDTISEFIEFGVFE